MARSLSFIFKGGSFDAELIKVDRSQLYGSVRVITKDVDNRHCTVATLASDGKTLIPRGGTALGYVNTEGEWVSRDELQTISLGGDPIEEVPSSFDAPIELKTAVDATVLLNHSVRLTYRLGIDNAVPKAFKSALLKGSIFQFGFSYRGGVGHDPTFILLDDDEDTVWMLVTEADDVQYISLEQAALCTSQPVADEIGNDDEDDLDFGML